MIVMTETERDSMIDIKEIRKDFRFFDNPEIAYLDNSATSQRPERVINAVNEYYRYSNANPFRGLYDLSIRATDKYEEAREKVKLFINASSEKEIIFTRNASESLNLAAFSLGEMLLHEGDEIITTVMEHHSNLLPWQQTAKRHGATVRYLKVDEEGKLDMEELKSLLNERTKIVSLSAMSNVFGRINDIKTIAGLVHGTTSSDGKSPVLVADGAQSVPHNKTDVKDMDVDLLAFSGHKMLAPMGIGVLYGKEKILKKMPPFLTGGEMIETVSLDEVTFAELPHKFEAGTVNAGGAVGLAAAIDLINEIGMDEMVEREHYLTKLAFDKIADIHGIRVLGSKNAEEHNGIITFKVEGVHPHDVASIMAEGGVAVRAGHHCAEPLHQFLKIPSTTRASIMFYNTEEEVERFTDVLATVRPLMGYKD